MSYDTHIKDMTQEEIDALMAKVLSGEYTQEEYDVFSAWLASDNDNLTEFRKARSYWKADISDRFEIDPTKELERLMKRVDKASGKRSFFSIKRILQVASIAASLVIGVFAGWMWSDRNCELSHEYTFMTGDAVSAFVLPDGSKVHLNKDSRLCYTASFGKKERRVRLVGEGYFEVERMEDCKFVVDLDGAGITVKGTTFDAFNCVETGIKGAALVSGSIEFHSNSQNLLLTPSRKVEFNSRSNELTISEFDPALLTAWKDHLFRYKSLSIYELAEKLMNIYGICVVPAAGEFENGQYSGALDTGLPAPQIMDILAAQSGAEWTKKNDIYYMFKPDKK